MAPLLRSDECSVLIADALNSQASEFSVEANRNPVLAAASVCGIPSFVARSISCQENICKLSRRRRFAHARECPISQGNFRAIVWLLRLDLAPGAHADTRAARGCARTALIGRGDVPEYGCECVPSPRPFLPAIR